MDASPLQGKVVAVCCNPEPGLSKPVVDAVHLIENWGIEGDYHAGSLVRHRYLANKDPNRPNLRQALLVDAAIFTELAQQDIHIGSGMMGENITIEGIDVRCSSLILNVLHLCSRGAKELGTPAA